jgi:hypothetical protein
MLLVAAMTLVLGAWVPLGMKLVGAISLAGLCLVVGQEARRQGASRPLALLLGAVPLLLPSTIFQASLGMENMLFAGLVVLTLQSWLAGRRRWTIAVLGLPLLFLLRPEAVLLGICLAGLAVAERDTRSLGAVMLGAAFTLAELAALALWTGVPLEAAGLARAAFLRAESATQLTVLGANVWLSFKFVPFLLYCVPFAAVAWWRRKSVGVERSEVTIFAALFALPLLLHLLTLFPDTHFSRYFLYGYAVFFFLFARLMARAERAGAAPGLLLLAAVALPAATLVPYEHVLRARLMTSPVAETIEEMTPAFVRRNSDLLYEALGRPQLPVVIALQEVQVRGRLDDRFVIRPLDGVVDDRMRAFVNGRSVDYGGYFEARKVAFVVGRFPDGTGVCLRPQELLPAPPTVPTAFRVVVSPRGC